MRRTRCGGGLRRRAAVGALLLVVLPSWAFAVPRAPFGAAPEVTLRGPYLCLASQLYRGKEHIGVVYAFDGPPEVRAAVDRLMARYPRTPLDVAGEARFQASVDRELLYYVEPNEVEKKAHRESDWWAFPAAITGTLSARGGKRWITPTRILTGVALDPPGPLRRLDTPLAMPSGAPLALKVSDSLSIPCRPIPAGSYVQGSPFYQWPRCHDEYPHEVVLSRGFYMSETPITQEVFEAVLGRNPTSAARRGAKFPVENALWSDIIEFCQAVSARSGHKVRLPTGAEFEYVARVGTSDATFPAKYREQQSAIGNKGAPAVPVATRKPNAWGCYDMLTFYGWHACSDYDTANPTARQVDPRGPADGGPGTYGRGCHRALGGDQNGVRPNIHYWYNEGPKPEADAHWVGIFRIVVEAEAGR